MVILYCVAGRIKGAEIIGNMWLIPKDAEKADAFAACNMNYNGHSARVFKDKTGVSHSAYRKMLS